MQLDHQDSGQARAYEAWRNLSVRFNRELAGRYPFGDLSARDASPRTVKAFFIDYDAERASLRQRISGARGTEWTTDALRFLDQLDAVSAFFNGSLIGREPIQPVHLSIEFRAQSRASPGSEHVVSWSLSAGDMSAGYPNASNTLAWPYGQALVFDALWAHASPWRPTLDPRQSDMQVSGATASFVANGDWALLRMIDTHRPRSRATADQLDPSRILLEFTVPVARTEAPPGNTSIATARLYLGFNLAGKDPKTQAPAALTLPAAFPRSAPQIP